MPGTYYNEIDPYAAQWLRNLIAAGHIAPGDVDERDIRLVQPDDLRGYTQCHFFAGIGVWSYALRLAGWRDDEPVWTGSCPCPPFSSAGRKKACPQCGGTNPVPHVGRTGYFVCCLCGHEWHADERHLWPELWRLIRDGRPPEFFGEQVASGDGRTWLAAVRASLEILGYAAWGADTCAAGVGAPHIRQRLYFVGVAARTRGGSGLRDHGADGVRSLAGDAGATRGMAHPDHERCGEARGAEGRCRPGRRGPSDELADSERGAIRGRERGGPDDAPRTVRGDSREQRIRPDDSASGGAGCMAHAGHTERGADADGGADHHAKIEGRPEGAGGAGECLPPRRGGVAEPGGERLPRERIQLRSGGSQLHQPEVAGRRPACGSVALGDGQQSRLEGLSGDGDGGNEPRRVAALADGSTAAAGRAGDGTVGLADGAGGGCGERGDEAQPGRGGHADGDGFTGGFWFPCDWLPCRDGKARPVEPGTFPLAHGAPARVGRLRAYGNAINAEQARYFIEARMIVRAQFQHQALTVGEVA